MKPLVKPEGYVPFDSPPHLQKDFYKVSHPPQYPEGTQVIYSNLTPRNFKHAKAKMSPLWDNKAVFFGLNLVIYKYLVEAWEKGFFKRPWEHVEYEYRLVVDYGLGATTDLSRLKALHVLGYLPIEIRALPEGMAVGPNIPVMTIHNTLPEFFWLTNSLETVISAELWKGITAATIAADYRGICENWAQINGSPEFMIPWQCHDFSYRGLSGTADAEMVGSAHLSSFTGTDTLPAIWAAMKWYGANPTKETVGGSVPATEHSVMCVDGQDDEYQTYIRLLNLYPNGIVSIVSDTYDFWRVMTDYLPRLKNRIMAREGRLVIRPDSGDPRDIICGTAIGVRDLSQEQLGIAYGEYYELHPEEDKPYEFMVYCREHASYYRVFAKHFQIVNAANPKDTFNVVFNYRYIEPSSVRPEEKGAYQLLYDTFGGTKNEKGFIDLDTHIGLIYGDSITPKIYNHILLHLTKKGFSHSNLVVGVGSYTYQYVTRDTLGLAVKATYAGVKGVGRAIKKEPKTGDGTKTSATGILSVYEDACGEPALSQGQILDPQVVMDGKFDSGFLKVVYRNSPASGASLVTTLRDVRKRRGWSADLAE
jgi:nicotinamide phosphoribosyltransferase